MLTGVVESLQALAQVLAFFAASVLVQEGEPSTSEVSLTRWVLQLVSLQMLAYAACALFVGGALVWNYFRERRGVGRVASEI